MNKRFEVLDSFRGLAAISIVMGHLNYISSVTEFNFFTNAGLVVEFFFVLSGFVLAHVYAFRTNLSFKSFAISRTFRLFPLHISMLLVLIILEALKWLAYKNGILFTTQPFTLDKNVTEIIPNLFLLQSWFESFNAISWNSPSWSISIEYYMYLIFYASLLLKNKLRYLSWFAISATMFYLAIIKIDLASEITRGLSCFFAGSLSYLIYRNIHDKINFKKVYFTLIELLLLLSVIIIISSEFKQQSLLASIIFCLVILVFSFEKGLMSDILRKKIFIYCGKLSYSIYMTHWAILFIISALLNIISKLIGVKWLYFIDSRLTIDFGHSLINNLVVILIVLLVIKLSSYTYTYIELKGQAIGRRLNKLG